jgi:hypothetical protein
MKRTLFFCLTLVASAFVAPASHASDHIDGVKTAVDNAADLTDAFTFVSPQDPNKLVLIMAVHPVANSRSRFSNAVDYVFRIRPIDDAKKLVPSADARREQTITCSFTGGALLIEPNQHATCRFNLRGGEETIQFDTRTRDYSAGGSGQKNGIRVFAGVRSDPWFLDLVKTIKYVNGFKVEPSGGSNGLHGANVLGIVVEVDKSRLAGPLLAVTAQTVRR